MTDDTQDVRRTAKELAAHYRSPDLGIYGSDETDIILAIDKYKQFLIEKEIEKADQDRADGREVENFRSVRMRLNDLFMIGSELSIRADIAEDMIAKGYLVARDRVAEEEWLQQYYAKSEASKDIDKPTPGSFVQDAVVREPNDDQLKKS